MSRASLLGRDAERDAPSSAVRAVARVRVLVEQSATTVDTAPFLRAPSRQPMSHYAAGMGRRTFLTTMGGVVLAGQLVAEAQQTWKVYRIGWLEVTPWMPVTRKVQDALVEALRDRGFVEGQNVIFERRYSEGREDRFAGFVAELIRMRVDLILAPFSTRTRTYDCSRVRVTAGARRLAVWRDRDP